MSEAEMDFPSETVEQQERHGNVEEPEAEHQRSLPRSKSRTNTMKKSSNAGNDLVEAEAVHTPPPPLPHSLSRHNSGLPPTPPTMTNSDVAAAQIEQAPSPPPQVFADRVRNALESRKSGIVTPIGESQSPPTPDLSPREVIPQPRPVLRQDYASATDSFRTATEGWSGSGSNSMITSPIGEPDRKHDWVNIPTTTRLPVKRNDSDDSGTMQNEGSDVGEVRVKNYQVESDSDLDKNPSLHTNESTSPLFETNNRYHRLRAPINPGDDVKRVDNAVLYGTPLWKGVPKRSVPRKAEVKLEAPIRLENLTSLLPAEPATVPLPATERTLQLRSPVAIPSTAEGNPSLDAASPPTPVNESSLKGNNMAYQLIQEETAKRYSAISDGSGVQAVVVATPERQRTLRHTSRCESLRGEVGTPTNSQRNSLENTPTFKHKHGRSSSRNEASPTKHPDDFYASNEVSTKSYGHLTKSSIRVRSSSPDDRRRPTANIKLPLSNEAARPISRSISEQQPRALRRSKRDLGLDRVGPLRGDALTHRLRRTSADQRLDRDNSVRRTSLGSDFKFEEVKSSPKLRRTSHEQRLSHNSEVRHTSMSRGGEIPAERLPYNSILEVPQEVAERHLLPSATPMSIFSAVTEGEVCEARGMEIYPHNNSSVIMVHQGSQELHGLGVRDAHIEEEVHNTSEEQSPVFEAYVQGPTTSQNALAEPSRHVDSPLKNAHTTSEPPQLVFIPPTPIDDPDRQIVAPETSRDQVQRRPSFKDRMRRYSENLVQPLPFGRSNSFRRYSLPQRRPQTSPAERPMYLSSFWQPREFWEDYDSSDDDLEDGEVRLPPGGDTSDVQERRRSVFPRMMSVREKRTIEAAPKPRRIFTLPFTRGTQVEYVGLSGVGNKIKELKARRREQMQEKRREKLRGQMIRFAPDDGVDGTKWQQRHVRRDPLDQSVSSDADREV